ncbi:hypothetical protein ACORG1_31155 [Mycobacterium sp. TJFP1]
MADPPELENAIADAVKCGDNVACDQAAARAHGYVSVEHAVVSTLDGLMRTPGRHDDRKLFSRTRRQWLLRAALLDQQWACDSIGLEWATSSDPDAPSPYWPYRGRRDEAPGHAVSAEQARTWLVSAARRGDGSRRTGRG